jgi:hypothetical protein
MCYAAPPIAYDLGGGFFQSGAKNAVDRDAHGCSLKGKKACAIVLD